MNISIDIISIKYKTKHRPEDQASAYDETFYS